MADLIDRQAAKTAIRERMNELACEGVMVDCAWIDQVCSCVIDNVPSAEQRGNWIETDMGWDGDTAWVCSVCGEPWTLIDGTPDENYMHYCPNCGARMEE